MTTIEEHIANLKDSDGDLASALEKLIEERDNFKTQSRRWENQAKANMTDAEAKRELEKELEKLKDQKNTTSADDSRIVELEKELQDYEELKKKLSVLEQEKTRATLVSRVVRDLSIPDRLAGYLKGDTEEELKESAEQLKKDMGLGVVEGWASPEGKNGKGTLSAGKSLYEEYNKN